MEARVLKDFFDIAADADRKIGEAFELTAERFSEIEEKIPGFIEAVEKPTADTPAKPARKAPAKAPAKKRTAARKAPVER